MFYYQEGIFARWLFNTILYVVVGAGGATLLAIMGGYALAQFRFPGRKAVFVVIIGAISVPGIALAVPQFLLFATLGLTNTCLLYTSMLKTTSLVTAVPFTLELQFATNAIANRIYKPIPLLLVACFWYLLITSILMVVQSRLEAHFGKGFNARPVGTKGKQPPYDPSYPGKADGEPKDDVNKINQTTFAGLNA